MGELHDEPRTVHRELGRANSQLWNRHYIHFLECIHLYFRDRIRIETLFYFCQEAMLCAIATSEVLTMNSRLSSVTCKMYSTPGCAWLHGGTWSAFFSCGSICIARVGTMNGLQHMKCWLWPTDLIPRERAPSMRDRWIVGKSARPFLAGKTWIFKLQHGNCLLWLDGSTLWVAEGADPWTMYWYASGNALQFFVQLFIRYH